MASSLFYFFNYFLNIRGAELGEDGSNWLGGSGWQGARRLSNKSGSKVLRKSVYAECLFHELNLNAGWKT